MAVLAAIWRHPVKGVGAEPMAGAEMAPDPDRPLPGDRAWAILTGSSRDTGAWQPCRNFARGAHAPQLMAVTAETRGDQLAFAHPQNPRLEIDPASEGRALLDWIAPLWPAERPAPTALIRAPEEGMTDSDFPSVSILGLPSLHMGEAELEVVERIERCRATEANPDTGERDTDTLALLRDRFGPHDFGVVARVVRAGRIATGDEVQA